MTTHVFLPCRKGSQRVPRKNIRPFAGYQHGLIELKIEQLLASGKIDQVVLSTNDDEILDYAGTVKDSRLLLHKRKDSLGSSETSTDSLVAHALELIPNGNILWTHVTSPFFDTHNYEEAIAAYHQSLDNGFDSLMSVSVIHSFLWTESSPLNYDRNMEKWPRTQTISPVYEVNSAVFLNSAENYRTLGDRIGNKPYLFTTEKLASFDIDWPDDFEIAECVAKVYSKKPRES